MSVDHALTPAQPRHATPVRGDIGDEWVSPAREAEDSALREHQRIPGTLLVAFIAMAVGALASVVAWQQDWLLLYSDAQSHLTIARRIFDSKEPGFAQIGTVWLPFPHALLLPFVASYALWQTGLAAAIVGTGCLGVSAAALWRITTRVGFAPLARWITVAVFVLNPSLLYLHTVALTEPVLLAMILASLAGLSGWIFAKPAYSPGQLAIFAGAPAAAAVLTRYEGWAFIVVAALFVIIASWRRWRSLTNTIVLTLSYLAVPLTAIAWWISFNWVVFGAPLDFAQGEYSAAAQQQSLAARGLLPTRGNLGLSMTTFDWTVVGFIGIPLLVIAAAGLGLLLWRRGLSTTALLLILPGFVYPFAILSLYLGQTAIRNDHSLPTGLFNVRFAAGMVPVVALLLGFVVDDLRRRGKVPGWAAAALVLSLTVGFTAWAYAEPRARIDVIREGYSNALGGADSAKAAAWLAENNDGGEILIDEGANPILMKLNVPLDRIYARFTGASYDRALASPEEYVTWVYVDKENPADLVWEALRNDPAFASRFSAVFESGTVTIYQLLGGRGDGS